MSKKSLHNVLYDLTSRKTKWGLLQGHMNMQWRARPCCQPPRWRRRCCTPWGTSSWGWRGRIVHWWSGRWSQHKMLVQPCVLFPPNRCPLSFKIWIVTKANSVECIELLVDKFIHQAIPCIVWMFYSKIVHNLKRVLPTIFEIYAWANN